MDTQYQDIKSSLIQKREHLAGRLEKIESSKKRKEPLSADSGEQALELENHEVVDALDDIEIKELKKIDFAIERIDSGTYGSCVDCGNTISSTRLKAMPYASQCIECATENN
jgi:RNA polymerase-binding protein DksA